MNFSTATNVEIEMPVPSDATNPNVRTSMGSASYAPEKDSLVWKIKSFPGGKVGTNFIPMSSVDGLWCWTAHTCKHFFKLFFYSSWIFIGFVCFQEYMLRAEFRLPSITSEESAPERKAPIRVKFEIPYFTVSGIQVSPKSCIFSNNLGTI